MPRYRGLISEKEEKMEKLRNLRLHEELIFAFNQRKKDFFNFLLQEKDSFVYANLQQAIDAKEDDPEFVDRINEKEEFYLADGRLVIIEGHRWLSQGRHDPDPIFRFDWIAYFSSDPEKVSYWKKHVREHLKKRKDSLASWEKIFPGKRDLKNIWI